MISNRYLVQPTLLLVLHCFAVGVFNTRPIPLVTGPGASPKSELPNALFRVSGFRV